MSLHFENVSFTYPGAQHGIEAVTLAVEPGELLAVMGRSGSGKSTILRLTAGLLNGYEGPISINGKDRAGVSPCGPQNLPGVPPNSLFSPPSVWATWRHTPS